MDTLSIDTHAPRDEKPSCHTCHEPFLLGSLRRGEADKLGNIVQEILWCGGDYIVYRTCKGVFVHFADDEPSEARQRKAFNEICPELCELRYLTHEMDKKKKPRHLLRRIFRLFKGADKTSDKKPSEKPGEKLKRKAEEEASDSVDDTLFEHNMAQAIMLLMEGDHVHAKSISKAALAMAVTRCTNDNTIRYVKSSINAASLFAAILISALATLAFLPSMGVAGKEPLSSYFVAALFGVLGAAFSVITRVQSFQMKPCQQSNMNYMMARTRIVVGLIAGLMLFLLLAQPLGHAAINQAFLGDWRAVAVIGFVGGFAERLVPVLFRRTAAALEDSSGTPVQAARKSDGAGSASPEDDQRTRRKRASPARRSRDAPRSARKKPGRSPARQG